MEEISSAINNFTNNKTTVPDYIPAEALKPDTDTSIELLYHLFTGIWEKGRSAIRLEIGTPHKKPRKDTPETVPTTEESHFSQCMGKSSTE